MPMNKLGLILFSGFLIFATAPIVPAQSTNTDTGKKQSTTQKGSTSTEAGKATGSETQSSTKSTTQDKTTTSQKTESEKQTTTAEEKTGAKKTGAKKHKEGTSKKTSSMPKDKVKQTQSALKQQGFDPGPVDGIMGPMTMTALRNFQSHNGLQVTGDVNSETESALMGRASVGANRGSSSGTQGQRSQGESSQNQPAGQVYGGGQQSSGQSSQSSEYSRSQTQTSQDLSQSHVSSGEDVRQLQQTLADLGYNPGDANGMMTAQTQQAIREFQWLNNLPVTGSIDDQTNMAIMQGASTGVESAQLSQQSSTTTATTNGELERQKPGITTEEQTQSRTQGSTTTPPSTSTTPTGKVDKDGAERASKSAAILQDLTVSQDKKIPNELLERAQAIAVIPHVVKGAFGIGGRYGKGVVSQRMADGRWSAPAYIQIGGGSFGAQLGVEATDLVLVFTDRKALDLLEEGKDLKLGVDAGVTAGPIGRAAEAGVNAKLETAIYAYSRSKGLYAGVALDGAVLDIDNSMNEKVYGSSVNAKNVLNGTVAANSTVRPFMDALDRVVPKKRISQK